MQTAEIDNDKYYAHKAQEQIDRMNVNLREIYLQSQDSFWSFLEHIAFEFGLLLNDLVEYLKTHLGKDKFPELF